MSNEGRPPDTPGGPGGTSARTMLDLGLREVQQGRAVQARAWFTRAADSGDPGVAPTAMVNLGVLERDQGRLEEARAWFTKALATGQADAVAWTLLNIGAMDQREGRIESAGRRYAEAVATGHPQAAPQAQRGLDEVSKARAALGQTVTAVVASVAEFRRAGSADALRRARETALDALQAQNLLKEIPVERMNLGASLLDLYRCADDESFLKAAADCVDRIEPEEAWLPAAARRNYLALRGDIRLTEWNALYAGYPDAEVRGMAVLDDAITSLTKALKEIIDGGESSAGPSTPLFLDVVATLASATLAKRHQLKVTPDLEPSADLLRTVLAGRIGDPASRAQCGWLLGRILWEKYAENGEPSVLLEAVRRLGDAVAEAPPDDPKRPSYELRHLTALAWLARETQDERDAGASEGRLRDSWSRGLDAHPRGVLDSAWVWGDLQARQENWAASADAFAAAAGAAMTLLGRRGAARDRQVFLRRIRGLSVQAAFALARADRLAEAISMLERGRGIFFTEAVERDAGHAHRNAAEDPDAAFSAALGAIGAGRAVAFIVASWYGGAAIVLTPGRPPWRVDLPWLTNDEVERRLSRLTAAYQTERSPADTRVIVTTADGLEETRPWAPELDAVARWSWDACMGPLIGSLAGCDELALIPVGVLPLLPLHAAWTDGARTNGAQTGPDSAEPPNHLRPPGRTYALDLLAISYAPHLRAYLAAKDRWTGFADGPVLAIDDPGSAGAPALPGAELETAALEELFPQLTVLRGPQATAEAVKRELPRASAVHFGCHGIADLLDPLNSRLLLSCEDRLSIAEIGQLHLSGVQLCVLSACETAMIGLELPDEVVNLPTAFAQAGAATVVGSLWAVPDEATALLIGRFYRNLRREGHTPAQALRDAQRWLRDSSRAEQLAELPADHRPHEELSPATRLVLGRIRPTQRITDWAGLVVSA